MALKYLKKNYYWIKMRKAAYAERYRICCAIIRDLQKDEVVLLFDGYKNKNQAETVMQYHNITIIYTKGHKQLIPILKKLIRR